MTAKETSAPSAEDLQTLWDIVARQGSPEHDAAFMANWLRGTIKIPREVELRIYAKMKRELEGVIVEDFNAGR